MAPSKSFFRRNDADGDTEKIADVGRDPHRNAAHGALHDDTVAADFDDALALIRAGVAGPVADGQGKRVEPRMAARPGRHAGTHIRRLKLDPCRTLWPVVMGDPSADRPGFDLKVTVNRACKPARMIDEAFRR